MKATTLSIVVSFVTFLILTSSVSASTKKPVCIGLDAEFGRSTSTAADAIKKGILIAIEEINASGGVLGGRKLELRIKDNRSVPARAKQNTKEFGEDPDIVAIFCSRFSTVVIDTVETAHQYTLPLLDPWAASDKIQISSH